MRRLFCTIAQTMSRHRPFRHPLILTTALLCTVGVPRATRAVQILELLRDTRGRNSAQTAMGFLLLPTDAASLGRGQSAMGGSGAATIAAAPAATALDDNIRISLTHYEHVVGLRKEHAGICFPLYNAGTLGWYSTLFTTGRWSDSRTIDEERARIRAFDFATGFSFARAFLNRSLAAGLSLSYAESHLDEATARTAVLGADIRYAPFDWGALRVGIDNIGPSPNYGAYPEPLPVRAAAALQVEPFQAHPKLKDKAAVLVSAGITASSATALLAGAGAELTLARLVTVRGGYDFSAGGREPRSGVHAGAGLRIRGYGLDAGWNPLSPHLGPTWAITLTYHGDTVGTPSARDHYLRAARQYERGRYPRTIMHARRALSLDPSLWQAQALISRAQSAMLRSQGREIALLYTGNECGAFLSATGMRGGAGGLARQATLIRDIRRDVPVTFTINAGNMIEKITHPVKAQLAGRYLNTLAFDGVAVGSAEIDFGLDPLSDAYTGIRLTSSALRHSTVQQQVPFTLMQRGGYTLALLTATQPTLVDSSSLLYDDMVQRLHEILAVPDVASADLRILAVHGSWKYLQGLVPRVAGIEVVVCASLEERFETALRIDSTWILSAGARGTHVGRLLLRFDGERRLLSLDNRLLALDDPVPPDSAIEALVHTTTARAAALEAGIDNSTLRAGKLHGVFPFVSDRDGVPALYLKIMDRHAEFPLTRHGVPCDSPRMCPASGSIVYRTHPAHTPTAQLRVLHPDGSQDRPLVSSRGTVTDARFNHDGSRIYLTVRTSDTTTGLVRIDAGTGVEDVLPFPAGTSQKDPAFSPDGSTMAFVSNHEGPRQVYLGDVQGGNPRPLPRQGTHPRSPLFSSDGKLLAWRASQGDTEGTFDLMVYHIPSAQTVPVSRHRHLHDFIWLNDGRTILYSTGVNLRDYNLLDVITGESRKLIAGMQLKEWEELGALVIPWRGHDRIVYTRAHPRDGRSIWIVNTDGSSNLELIGRKGSNWTR